MPSTERTARGVLCIAAAIGLGIVSALFPYVWDVFLPSSSPAGQDSFYFSLHRLWIPLSGVLLIAASAVFFALGFLFVWGDRAQVDSGRRAFLGLATLAFGVATGAALVLTLSGVAMGLAYLPDLRFARYAANIGLTLSLGLSLYWLLMGVGLRQARLAGVLALVTGSASSALTVAALATQSFGLGAIGLALGFLSLTLWLALFLWGYEEMRLRGVTRPPGLPA